MAGGAGSGGHFRSIVPRVLGEWGKGYVGNRRKWVHRVGLMKAQYKHL